MPATCFQKENSLLLGTLGDSLTLEHAPAAFLLSTPGNRIPGWSNYLVILLFYLFAGFVDILRAFRRGVRSKPSGRRARTARMLQSFGRWLKSFLGSSTTNYPDKKSPSPTLSTIIFFFFFLFFFLALSCRWHRGQLLDRQCVGPVHLRAARLG
ncbi:hypothetical protein B0T25DRAFT_8745 [Lasiosphaeria hispida]|uniref:Uncharacterized protein n=1 Tax=Lasiosphaeria hispida TaxID=260671 RepID=A0AAJ0HTJ3_9PEZI|nr:hypothetical protein B0T25DRAFT_8745 [Lasiosphaeria hispida]